MKEMTIITTKSFMCIAPIFLDKEENQYLEVATTPLYP